MNAIPPDIQHRIQHWKARLTGLRQDNPLLKFVADKGKTIRLVMPASQVFQKLVTEEVGLLVSLSKIDASPHDHLTILRKLRKDANEVQREKGVNSLFIALGTLNWKQKGEAKNQTVSPILLIPVELQKPRGRDQYTIVAIGEDPILNPVLVQKLADDYGIHLRIVD